MMNKLVLLYRMSDILVYVATPGTEVFGVTFDIWMRDAKLLRLDDNTRTFLSLKTKNR